jgi:hypothetical protein
MATLASEDCCIVNQGAGAWAFEPLAHTLASTLGIEVSETPRRFNYFLGGDNRWSWIPESSFIPFGAIDIAADKRLLARAFEQADVPRPETQLVATFEDVLRIIRARPNQEWCLKYPLGCGASGHRFITSASDKPKNWPIPFIVQEFVRLERPEVYRIYIACGELFGWMVRRLPEGISSPWVAHVRGARYANLGRAPKEARAAARIALDAVGLLDSFGCADLIQRPSGEWLVLEVGTDGIVNYIDRDLGDPAFEGEVSERIAAAFWRKARLK